MATVTIPLSKYILLFSIHSSTSGGTRSTSRFSSGGSSDATAGSPRIESLLGKLLIEKLKIKNKSLIATPLILLSPFAFPCHSPNSSPSSSIMRFSSGGSSDATAGSPRIESLLGKFSYCCPSFGKTLAEYIYIKVTYSVDWLPSRFFQN